MGITTLVNALYYLRIDNESQDQERPRWMRNNNKTEARATKLRERQQESNVLTEMLTNICWILLHFVRFAVVLCFYSAVPFAACVARCRFRFSFYRFPTNSHSISMVWHFNTQSSCHFTPLSVLCRLSILPRTPNDMICFSFIFFVFFVIAVQICTYHMILYACAS